MSTLLDSLPNLATADLAALAIESGKRYVIFADANIFPSLKDLEGSVTDDVDVQIIFVIPPPGSTVADCVAAFRVGDTKP